MHAPPIPAGFTTRFARPDDRSALWWDPDELQVAADRFGLKVAKRTTRPVASERDLGVRVPLGLDAVDFFNLVIFGAIIGIGLVSLVAILALARHGLDAIAWSLVGILSAIGLTGGVLRFLVTTGWMETEPGRRRRQS